MCGIAGVVSKLPFTASQHRSIVSMSETLVHRGPDSYGSWTNDNDTLTLCHRRLAIVDLSLTGSQPMLSTSGRFVISYNGEIYNHMELRNLVQRNHGWKSTWRGSSDTESLLVACEVMGIEETLKKSRGMFSLALYDRKDELLYLARDRLGEKPLYYCNNGIDFSFTSELRALELWKGRTSAINSDSLRGYFQRGYISGGKTILEDCFQVPPGSILSIDCSGKENEENWVVKKTVYWSLDDVIQSRALDRSISKADHLKQLDQVMQSVVSEQMLSDVPVGSFLSGGIDSSLVTMYMQMMSSQSIKTFSVSFKEKGYDEHEHAQVIADHLSTDHTKIDVTGEDALKVIMADDEFYDEPFSDPSQIPMIILARKARSQVTVALTGDGGDEIFGGYSRHVNAKNLERLYYLPYCWRQMVSSGLLKVPAKFYDRINMDMTHKVNRIAKLLSYQDVNMLFSRIADQGNERLMLANHMHDSTANTIHEDRPHLGLDQTEFMMYLDSLQYLPSNVLVKVDRAGMSSSLETRAPFLDKRVVEFAWSLPISEKVGGGEGKLILRELLRNRIPASIVDRKKQGFNLPIAEWLRGPLRCWATSLLVEVEFGRPLGLDYVLVRQLWDQHLAGTKNNALQIWITLCFLKWHIRRAEKGLIQTHSIVVA